MRVVLAGASGFLGSHLRESLAADGHELVRLVRRPPTHPDEYPWDPAAGSLDATVLAGADAMVNLAGSGVEDRRWTDAYRRKLRESRVGPTNTLAVVAASLPADQRPRLLVNASAVGFYGNTGDATVDESSKPGGGFFAKLCQDWEDATTPAREAGIRVVLLRTGLVLASDGGLLRPFVLATRLFAGGPLAGGRWWMPWISMQDWLGAVRFLMAHPEAAGPFNVVGPDPVRNKDFTRALGRIMQRPTPWPVPKFALRVLLGDFAEEAVTSLRALPTALTGAGYAFQHAAVEDALRAALSR